MRMRAGKSTGWPSRFAGLDLIYGAAWVEDSSRPRQIPLRTRFT
jgi:hypothetical protein